MFAGTGRGTATIDPRARPLAFSTRPDGRVAVEVRQVVRSLDGTPLGEGRGPDVYAFRGGLVARMDVGGGRAPGLSRGRDRTARDVA